MRTAQGLDAADGEPGIHRAGDRADTELQEARPCRPGSRRGRRAVVQDRPRRRARRCGRRGTWWSSARPRRRRATSGCCRYGEAKVLSTTTIAPAACAISATAAMSVIFMSGLLGVSSQTTLVASGRMAARTASRSLMLDVSRARRPTARSTRLTSRCGAAVDVVAHQHVVAGLQDGAQQGVFGGETGREAEAAVAALERGEQGLRARCGSGCRRARTRSRCGSRRCRPARRWS